MRKMRLKILFCSAILSLLFTVSATEAETVKSDTIWLHNVPELKTVPLYGDVARDPAGKPIIDDKSGIVTYGGADFGEAYGDKSIVKRDPKKGLYVVVDKNAETLPVRVYKAVATKEDGYIYTDSDTLRVDILRKPDPALNGGDSGVDSANVTNPTVKNTDVEPSAEQFIKANASEVGLIGLLLCILLLVVVIVKLSRLSNRKAAKYNQEKDKEVGKSERTATKTSFPHDYATSKGVETATCEIKKLKDKIDSLKKEILAKLQNLNTTTNDNGEQQISSNTQPIVTQDDPTPTPKPEKKVVGYAQLHIDRNSPIRVEMSSEMAVIKVYRMGDDYMFNLVPNGMIREQLAGEQYVNFQRMRDCGYFDFNDDDMRGAKSVDCTDYGYLRKVGNNEFIASKPLKIKPIK